MSAAYLLARLGVDVAVLEAAPQVGGRIKTARNFVDFPIPLGGEWIHVDADVLDRIVDDPTVEITTEVVGYGDEDETWLWDGAELSNLGPSGDTDLKIVGDTWLTFFEQYVLPSIDSRIQVGTPVQSIERTDDAVVITDATGTAHEADAVVVTVPIQVIKDRDISFMPPLSSEKLEAFDAARVWTGMKVFIEFEQKFWPSSVVIEGSDSDAGQKLWYDASHGQDSGRYVLGLFTVGDQSIPYQQQSGDGLRDFVLAELDEMSDGVATPAYVQHLAQNWAEEPFIRQAYFADSGDWQLPSRMRQPVGDQIFFAGDAYTDGSDWSSVHTAAQSAREAVELMVDAGVV